MAFDPDAYLKGDDEKASDKPKFDPDAYLKGEEPGRSTDSASPETKSEPMSPAMTAMTKAVDGLSFGIADEAAGAMDAFGRVLGLEGIGSGDIRDAGFAEGGPTIDLDTLKQTYLQGRDKERLKSQKAETDNPKLAAAADIAGSVMSPVPGATMKAMSKMPKLMQKFKALSHAKKGIAAGTAAGAAEGAARSEADDFSGVLVDSAAGGAGGGVLGGVLGKIGGKLSKEGIEEVVEQAPKDANIAAMKSMGATASDIKKEFNLKTNKRATTSTAKGTGQTALDEGLVKIKQSPAELKDAFVDKLDEVVKERMGPTITKLDDMARERPAGSFYKDFTEFTEDVGETLKNSAGNSNYAEESAGAIFKSMNKTAENVNQDVIAALKGPDKFKELLAIKQKLQREINWKNPQASTYNQFLIGMQGNISKLMNRAGKGMDSKLGSEIAENNKTYMNLISGNEIAGNSFAKDITSGGKIGIGEYVAAGVISNLSDTPIAGPLAIGSKKLVEQFTGKDLGKIVESFTALRKNQAAKKAAKSLEGYEGSLKDIVSGNSTGLAVNAVAAKSALTDETNVKEAYKKDRIASDYIKTATPEALVAEADRVANEFGKSGDKLSNTLRNMAGKDRQGRNALMFSILQDPSNRKMLGLIKEDDSE